MALVVLTAAASRCRRGAEGKKQLLREGDGTIFALATGARKAAIAIFRISGVNAAKAVIELCGLPIPEDRRVVLRAIRDPQTGQRIDQGLVTWFEGPGSFTGEDVAEIAVTGGRAVVSAVGHALGAVGGVRPAGPGEFAYRAFLNGKLDLSSVEGLAYLIEAETEQQRIQAQRVAGGALLRECEGIREVLGDALIELEARIDFSDDGDMVGRPDDQVRATIGRAKERVETALSSASHAQKIRDGFVVALVGPPNVGKSTLMNALVGRNVAITSETAGTTRDAIEAVVDVRGLPVVFVDTAGLRETEDAVEQEGVARAFQRARNADLTLWLYDNEEQRQVPAGIGPVIEVRTKSDLAPESGSSEMPPRSPPLRVSGTRGDGVDELLAVITELGEGSLSAAEPAVLIVDRHRRAFEDAHEALCSSLDASEIELIAEDVRRAVNAMERVTGRIGVEEVLDGIFSRMCIGK